MTQNWFAAFLVLCAIAQDVGAQDARAQAQTLPPAQSTPSLPSQSPAPSQAPAPSDTPAQNAPGSSVDRNVQAMPGRDVRVGIYASIKQDCTSGPLPAIRLVTPPAHGTITMRRATLKTTNFRQCLAADVPAFVAIYHAAQDFNGADEFELEVNYSGGRKQTKHFHVNVSNTPNGGQGI